MQTINDALINAILADAVYVDDIVKENVVGLTGKLTKRMGPKLANKEYSATKFDRSFVIGKTVYRPKYFTYKIYCKHGFITVKTDLINDCFSIFKGLIRL